MRSFRFSLLLLFALIQVLPLRADEGMWLPFLIRDKIYGDMAKQGLELSPEEIYSVNNSSLKDAIVAFGGFCTGEVISDQGLVLTNHHCGYDAIRGQSTPEKNILKDGFWAMKKGEEKPIEGLYVSFLVRAEDVTDKVLEGIDYTTPEEQREKLINERIPGLVAEATEGTGYNAEIKPFFNGNEYYMMVYETYKDIRLVGAPPEAIGKFGGDTDNWMWPRHTGDFSMFRIYASPDNEPAEYSEENVPYQPKHHLPISLKGVDKKDFAMILGYPGGTDRYRTSYGVELSINKTNPARVKLRGQRLDIMDKSMSQSDKVRLQYASKYARISNYHKYFIGQTRGLKNLEVVEKKKALEERFMAWVEEEEERQKKYGNALPAIQEGFEKMETYALPAVYWGECMMAPEILSFAAQLNSFPEVLSKYENESSKLAAFIQKYSQAGEGFYENYHKPTDKKVFAAMMERYAQDIPKEMQAPYFRDLDDKYDGDYEKMADKLFRKSFLGSKEDFDGFLAKPRAKKLKKDPAFELASAFLSHFREKIYPKFKAIQSSMERGQRLYLAGLREMMPEKDFYSNANYTMRLTYGQVLAYEPRDAVFYNYYTTQEGIMEKMDNTDPEFKVPEKLQKLIEEGDFGRYGEDGTLFVGFITNHDITGGNSGSPVINGKGELIGCAFDGNWEAMSGDIAFEPDIQRTISVDIRYVLFVIDKVGGAGHLVDEMTLVK